MTTFTVVTPKKTFTVALFGAVDQLRMFRISVPDVLEGRESEDDLRMIQLLKEHMIAILRLTYDRGVELSRSAVWAYESPAVSFPVK